jgi:hypothetical protein
VFKAAKSLYVEIEDGASEYPPISWTIVSVEPARVRATPAAVVEPVECETVPSPPLAPESKETDDPV